MISIDQEISREILISRKCFTTYTGLSNPYKISLPVKSINEFIDNILITTLACKNTKYSFTIVRHYSTLLDKKDI